MAMTPKYRHKLKTIVEYAGLKPSKEIAEMLNLPVTDIQETAKNHRISLSLIAWEKNREEIERLIPQYYEQMTIKEFADKFGFQYGAVYRCAKRMNLKFRYSYTRYEKQPRYKSILYFRHEDLATI